MGYADIVKSIYVKQIIYENYDELSKETADLIAGIILEKPDALLCFPAGETSVGTFNRLIELNKSGALSFRNCRIVGLDEWAGLGEMSRENCFGFLKQHLFDHINNSEENLCFFDGESTDLAGECAKTDNFIRQFGPIDMILLGAGMNGHLGLNEPGTPFNTYSHIVSLDETTKTVGQKYFSRKVNLAFGITLGLGHIMEAGTVILQLNGTRKAKIAREIMDSEISPALPASILKSLGNSFMLLDKEAAGYSDHPDLQQLM